MKVIPILAKNNNTEETDLLAMLYDNSPTDEFENAFDNWYNPEFLLKFFSNNYDDLSNGYYDVHSIEDAIDKTIDEAYEFEKNLLNASYGRIIGKDFNLNRIFKPLNNNDYRHESDLQKTKARYNWLRLYSIKLYPSSFVVSGSAIKLCLEMNRPHLKIQLINLEKTKIFLDENGCINSEDLNKLL